MPSCPECENELDLEVEEVEEGDVVACEECGTEYEIVGVEPLELTRVGDELDDDDCHDESVRECRRLHRLEHGGVQLAGVGGSRLAAAS